MCTTIVLDAHILLWALAKPEQLTDSRTQLIEDRSNTVYASAVSAAARIARVHLVSGESVRRAAEASSVPWTHMPEGGHCPRVLIVQPLHVALFLHTFTLRVVGTRFV